VDGRVPAEGERLGRISNAVVAAYRQHVGRGPTRAKTYLLDDYVVTVTAEGLTSLERTLTAEGRPEIVRSLRGSLREAIGGDLRPVVEETVRRPVVAHVSQMLPELDLGFELFVLG
jgi:uncharacterized protein YbcI